MLSTFIFLCLLVNGNSVIKVEDYINKFSGNASACITYCLMEACSNANSGPVTVLFPSKVTLNLTGDNELVISDCTVGLTIDGNGAKLIQTNPTIGVFRFYSCDSVLVKNLTIDYNPLPFTQGRVKKILSDREAEIAIDIGFPSPMEWYFNTSKTLKWGLLRDNKPPYLTLKLGISNVIGIESWTEGGVVDGHEVYTVKAEDFGQVKVEVGDPWVHVARCTRGIIFLVYHSNNMSFEDITIYAAPGASYTSYYNSNVSFTRSYTLAWPGRYLSTGADGIFCVGNRNGPKIKDCILQAIGDDALIFKQQGYSVEKVEQNGKVLTVVNRLERKSEEEWETGYLTMDEFLLREEFASPWKDDTLAAYNPESGTYLGTAKIIDVDSVDTYAAKVTLDVSFDGLVTGTEWNSTIIYNLNTANEGYEVTGTTVYSSRRYGLLTMSPSGIVINSSFIGNPGNAVMMMNSGVDFRDSAGFVANDLMLVDNIFSDNLRSNDSIWFMGGNFSAVIACAIFGLEPPPHSGSLPEDKSVSWKGYHNFQVYNNKITQEVGNFPAILLSNVNGSILSGNVISKSNKSPGLSIYDALAITVKNNIFNNGCITVDTNSTANVTINGNILPLYCN